MDVIRVVILLTTLMIGLSCLPVGPAEAASPFTPSFSPEVGLVPYDQQSRQQGSPAMGIDGNGNLYALWVDYRNGHSDIYFAYRPAGGFWGPNVKVNDDSGTAAQSSPALAVDDGGNAFAVWGDERNGNGDIYFAHRPAGGTWGANKKVNDDTGTEWQGNPDVAIGRLEIGDTLACIIWQDFRTGTMNLYSAVVFSPFEQYWIVKTNTRVNDEESVLPANPSIGFYSLLSTHLAIAVWEDRRNGNDDIYTASRALDTGGTWGTNTMVNDDGGNSDQLNPKIAIRGNYIMYVWEDYRNGNYDIYSYAPPLMGPRPPNEKVNDDTGNATQTSPSIFIDGSNMAHVTWVDDRNGLDEIYYGHPFGGGSWFNKKINCQVSSPQDPIIAISDSSQIYVLFTNRIDQNPDIFFTWEWELQSLVYPLRVNDDPPGTVIQRNPSLAVDRNGNATALWCGSRNGVDGAYYQTFPSGGSWGNFIPVGDVAYYWLTSLALDQNNNAYALLAGGGIFFSYKPVGNNWSTLEAISTGNNRVFSPDIALDPTGNAYAIWTEDYPFPDGWDILSAYRPAGGAWGAHAKVTDESTMYKASPSIVVDKSGNALAVWEDDRKGTAIFASYRPVGGTWGKNVQVSDGTDRAFSPAIALDGAGNAYTLWQCQAPGGLSANIYFAYRPFQGTWGIPEKVTSGSAWNFSPDIAVDDQGNAFAVWVSDQSVVFFYRPVGGTWSGPFQVSTDITSGKANPAIALDGKKNIYILWEDYRYGIGILSPAVYFSYALGPMNKIYLPLINK